MNERELFKFLKKNTKLTDEEIKRDLRAGIACYPNDEHGYKEFYEEYIEGFCDEDEILYIWDSLEVVRDIDTKMSYRFNWVL